MVINGPASNSVRDRSATQMPNQYTTAPTNSCNKGDFRHLRPRIDYWTFKHWPPLMLVSDEESEMPFNRCSKTDLSDYSSGACASG